MSLLQNDTRLYVNRSLVTFYWLTIAEASFVANLETVSEKVRKCVRYDNRENDRAIVQLLNTTVSLFHK